MMQFYDYTLNIQVGRYLGRRFCSPSVEALAKSYVKPMQAIKDKVVATRNQLLRQMSYSSLTIVVEKMLNDEFDPVLRRIRVENLEQKFKHAVVRRIEEVTGPGLTPTLIVRRMSESEVGQPEYQAVRRIEEEGEELSFQVNVNNDISYDRDRLIALVNRYRTAGKTWGIYNTSDLTTYKVIQFITSE